MCEAVSVMRYAYTKILIVTCYLLLQGQKCRCASVVLSLFLRSRDYRMNGLITDLERRYNGLALEEVKSSQNLIEAYITLPSYTNPQMRGYDGLCVFPLEVAAYSRHTSV